VKFGFDIRLSFKTEMTNLRYCENSKKDRLIILILAHADYAFSSFKVVILNQKDLGSSITFDESKSLEGINSNLKLSSFKRPMQKLIV
jgi:hypothetical protein